MLNAGQSRIGVNERALQQPPPYHNLTAPISQRVRAAGDRMGSQEDSGTSGHPELNHNDHSESMAKSFTATRAHAAWRVMSVSRGDGNARFRINTIDALAGIMI